MAGKAKITVDKGKAKQRVKAIFSLLKKRYPEATIALKFSNPLELLVATILSAQCTDVRVNIVTKDLFKKYRSAADWAGAELGEIEDDIRSTGFYRNKSKNIKSGCQKIIDEFGGAVPSTMSELVSLPGVGRKTANVLLGNIFDTPGIACDTHVIRLSRRLGLSDKGNDAVKLEADLAEIVAKRNWTLFSHVMIFHGRNICKARKPDCLNCPVSGYCPSANKPELW